LLFNLPATAQIVNIESKRMQSDTVGWLGGAGAAVSIAQNKQKIFGADAEFHLQYKTSTDKGLWLILGSYGFLKGGNIKYVQNRFGHLRYNRKINEWLRWEIFVQMLDNLITQIDSRLLTGTGPRFKIVKTSILRLYAASLIMYEREKELTTPVIQHEDIRSSSYVSFTFTPRDNIEIISTTFYQPLIRKTSDYRVLSQATIRVKATKHFSLSVKWDFLHDSSPAGIAPKTTYRLATGIDFEL
jgi:hypothetical protein